MNMVTNLPNICLHLILLLQVETPVSSVKYQKQNKMLIEYRRKDTTHDSRGTACLSQFCHTFHDTGSSLSMARSIVRLYDNLHFTL